MNIIDEKVNSRKTHLGTANVAYRVTFVSETTKYGAEIISKDGVYAPLVAGRVLEVNDKIVSLNSYLEIRDNNGLTFKLGPNSEFVLEPTFEGIIPVYWGEVYTTPQSNGLSIFAQQKYRTSCFISPMASVYMENIEKNFDGFYALSEDVLIYEYDEKGKRFPIVIIPEGYVAVLEYKEDKAMRERYIVSEISVIEDKKYDHITESFLNPRKWN